MPQSPLRFCTAPGCGNRVDGGRCPAHSRDRQRGGSTSRGYDAAWQSFRRVYLAQHPLCCDCADRNQVTPATEIHHKLRLAEHPALKYVEGNLMALCKACHDTRTRRGE